MKRVSVFAALVVVLPWAAARAASGLELSAETAEVVVAPQAPSVVRFAADELTNFLSQVLGGPVPIAESPTAGKASVVLGSNVWTRAAGIRTEILPRDAFEVVVRDGTAFIAGRDDVSADVRQLLRKGEREQEYERATLFGVYDFLERTAGVRFYFPGELGTVVPRREALPVPSGRRTVSPAFTYRRYSFRYGPEKARALNWLRLRMETYYLQCCHGTRDFKLLDRFAKSNPEYFALLPDPHTKDLKRDNDRNVRDHSPGQLCHTSAVWDRMAEIASHENRPVIDVMPEDGFRMCQCENCRREWREDWNGASELIWRRTAEFARRMKRARPGVPVTQMVYTPYRRVPDFDLPDNLKVMVAEMGPWSPASRRAIEDAEIRAWRRKMGASVYLWTYPAKVASLKLDDIPQMTPHAVGRYFRELAPDIFGAYYEAETDRFIYNYLNYYVFSRVAWDPEADIEALIAEHHRLMFDSAADEMAAFYGGLEKTWLAEITGRVVDTVLGPAAKPPGKWTIWNRVYTPELLSSWRDLLGKAAKKVAGEDLPARRVALIREELFEPLAGASRKWLSETSPRRGLELRRTEPNRSIVSMDDFPKSKRTTEERIATPFSIELKGEKGASVTVPLSGRLRPSTKYRISFFLKLDGVAPIDAQGGTLVQVFDNRWNCFPRSGRDYGSSEWMFREFEFVSAPDVGAKGEPSISLFVAKASGRAWFDDIRLEEVE